MNSVKLVREWRIVAVLLALISMSSFSARASELTKSSCALTHIQFDNGRLALWCSGDSNIYYAFYSAPSGCPTQTTDVLKAWLAMSQAALLAGRTVEFRFENSACSSGKAISWGFNLY